MKKVLICRLGAYGDLVMVTPLLRLLKEDGYHVTVNVNSRGAAVLENNPNVDAVILHQDDSVPHDKLGEHWKKLSEGFDRFINLSGSIEKGLLKVKEDMEYTWTQRARHELCNVNYYDRTLSLGGYSNTGLNGELYFTKEEEEWGQKIKEQHAKRFMILWSLSGSSVHKFYPYSEYVGPKFLNEHEDSVIFTVGDYSCRLIEWSHERTKKRVGVWPIRKSFVMTKYADVVIGPETGVLNASGCFQTPKIVFLSHSSHENLTKYWQNCHPIEADKKHAPCHPCHKMIYSTADCNLNNVTKLPVCTAHLAPEILLKEMESTYQDWKEKNGSFCRQRQSTVFH